MEPLVSKEKVEELMSLKGEVRGVAFKTEEEFVLKEEGEEGLERLEEAMKETGQPLKFKKIKPMDFYPLGLLGITQLVIKRLFNYSEEKIQELGKTEAKVSLIMKLFMKYFVSLERMKKEVPKIWRKYYSTGDLKVEEMNEGEKYVIMRLKNFKVTPVHCQDLVGYFGSVLQMIVNSPVTSRETKCPFRGNSYHEFLLKWE